MAPHNAPYDMPCPTFERCAHIYQMPIRDCNLILCPIHVFRTTSVTARTLGSRCGCTPASSPGTMTARFSFGLLRFTPCSRPATPHVTVPHHVVLRYVAGGCVLIGALWAVLRPNWDYYRQPYCNLRLDNELHEARLLFWQVAQLRLTGFLYWDLNYWGQVHAPPGGVMPSYAPIDGAALTSRSSTRRSGPRGRPARTTSATASSPTAAQTVRSARSGCMASEMASATSRCSRPRRATPRSRPCSRRSRTQTTSRSTPPALVPT